MSMFIVFRVGGAEPQKKELATCTKNHMYNIITPIIHNITRIKNIKKCNKCREGMPKSMQTR